jgi:hypothetical protein
MSTASRALAFVGLGGGADPDTLDRGKRRAGAPRRPRDLSCAGRMD